jgi:hypothetical protein
LPPIRCHADGQVLPLACNLAAIIPPIRLRAQSEAGLSEDERLVLPAAALEKQAPCTGRGAAAQFSARLEAGDGSRP